MKEKQSSKLYYGVDIFTYSEMRSKVELSGFMNYEDVDVIDIGDFFYSSFDYKGYNYILYDDQGASSYPVASVFSQDISQLPFLTSNATFEHKPQISYAEDEKKYVFSKGDESAMSDDCVKIFKTYQFPSHIDYLSTLFSVYINYKADNKISVCTVCDDEKQILSVLQKFFSLSASELKISKSDEKLELGPKYIVSVIRACIIAIKAALKYKSDIVYQFNPFFAVGTLTIDDYLYLRMDNTTIAKRELKISYDMGKSTLFEDKIVEAVEKSSESLLSPICQSTTLKLSHNDVHSSTVSPDYITSYIYSASCYAFLEVARAFKVTNDYYLTFCLEARKPFDDDATRKIKDVENFFSISHFKFKDAIFRHNSNIAPPVSSLEFESKRAVAMLSAFVDNQISLCLISFNKKLKQISDINLLLPKFDADTDLCRVTSYILKALNKYGFMFLPDFTSSNIRCEVADCQCDIDPIIFCSIFMKSFKLEYENL